jgi:phosphoserine phosphatase
MDIRAGENISELLSEGVLGEHVAEAVGIAEEMVRMKASRSDNLQETAAWGRFAARYWKFYRLLFREQGSAFACEWRNRIFAGYSPAELRKLAHDAVVRDLAKGGLSRDRNVPSEFRGLAFPREIKELFRRLRAAGVKVYIVSATMRDFLLAATGPDFGLDFDPDCVFGSNLKLGADGRYLPVFNEAGVKSGEKANFIRKTIAWRHHGAEPVLAAGDSMGDYDMLTGFPALQSALVFDRRLKEPLLAQLIASAPASGGKVLVQTRDEVRGVLIPAGETVKP